MRRSASALLVSGSLALVPGCGGDSSPDPAEQPAPPVVADGGAGVGPRGDAAGPATDAGRRRDASFTEDELADATFPPDVRFSWDAPPGDAPLSEDAACAESSATATLRPLDLFVVLDRSGSMSETSVADSSLWGQNDCNVSASPANASKWCLAVNALGSFFQLQGQGDRRAALQFFPRTLELGGGIASYPSGPECTGETISTPAVPLSAIPARAADLIAALNVATPAGAFTTTEGAIRGMNAFTSNAANRSATRTLAQLLITDGAPTACPLRDNPALAALIDTQRTRESVGTYVVGMNGANYTNLEALAAAGGAPAHTTLCAPGTASCHYYDVQAGSAAAFSAALRDIQLAAVGCTYNLPAPARGVLDPERVRVSQVSGAQTIDYARVQTASACGAGTAHWHYDNNATPTAIRLCPAACTAVRANAAAGIRVLFGCLRG